MTATQRAAMQQALEDLTAVLCDPDGRCCIDGSSGDRAIVDCALSTIRAALAKPETVADKVKAQAFDALSRMSSFRPMKDGRHPRVVLHAFIRLASPPARQPLTDEEIVDAVRDADLDWHAGWSLDDDVLNRYVTLIRAVERAHGIGGNDEQH